LKKSRHSQIFEVRLHETDLGAIAHHSNYFHWIEQTEYSLFASIDENVIGELDSKLRGSGWPRAEIQVKFIKPLRFRDKLRVDLHIERIRSAGITYGVKIYKLLGDIEELVLTGRYSAVCCMYDATGKSYPEVVPIPDSFLEKIEVADI